MFIGEIQRLTIVCMLQREYDITLEEAESMAESNQDHFHSRIMEMDYRRAYNLF